MFTITYPTWVRISTCTMLAHKMARSSQGGGLRTGSMANASGRSITSPYWSRRVLRGALDVIESTNGVIENATRLAAFKVALQAGKPEAQAASIAKNVTVNFNRKGT